MSVWEVIKKIVDGGIAFPPNPSCPFLLTAGHVGENRFFSSQTHWGCPWLWSRIHLIQLSLRGEENIAYFILVFSVASFSPILPTTFSHIHSTFAYWCHAHLANLTLISVMPFTSSGKELSVISVTGQFLRQPTLQKRLVFFWCMPVEGDRMGWREKLSYNTIPRKVSAYLRGWETLEPGWPFRVVPDWHKEARSLSSLCH